MCCIGPLVHASRTSSPSSSSVFHHAGTRARCPGSQINPTSRHRSIDVARVVVVVVVTHRFTTGASPPPCSRARFIASSSSAHAPRTRPDACAGSAIGRAMGRFVRRVRPARAIADATADLSLARASSDGWTCAMAWRRSRATSTTSRETSSDGDDADGDADDADDADALDVEVEVAREGCGRDRWRRTRGDAWGGCVPGRDWSMGSCDTFKTRRSQRRPDDWTTGRRRAHTKNGRSDAVLCWYFQIRVVPPRTTRHDGMIGEASADEARKPWRWFWC